MSGGGLQKQPVEGGINAQNNRLRKPARTLELVIVDKGKPRTEQVPD
jgi:hypothetical protein